MNRQRSEINSCPFVWADWVYSLGLLALLLLLIGPPLFSNNAFIYKLDIDYFFAHETVLRQELTGSRLALWNPFFGGGSPTLSKIQIGIFYPPLMLMRELLPPVPMFNWDMVLHLYVAGLGMYWFLRDWKVRPVGAMLGAVTFMLSGAFIPRVFAGHISVIHSIAWSGWLLLTYRRLLLQRSWWWLLLVSVLSALTILGGHPQMSLIALLIPGSYFVAHVWQKARQDRRDELLQAITSSLAVALVALGLVAIQLFPFVEWLRQTSRGQGEAGVVTELMTRDSLYPHELLTIFFPYLWVDLKTVIEAVDVRGQELFWEKSTFAGIVTILIAALGLLLRRRTRGLDRRTHYLLALGLFGLFMGMGNINPLYLILERVAPYFRSPGRFLLLWSFALSALAGISLDYLQRNLTLSATQMVLVRVRARWSGFVFVTLALYVIWLVAGRSVIRGSELPEHARNVIVNGFDHTFRTAVLTMLLIQLWLWVSARWNRQLQRVWSYLVLSMALIELFVFARPLLQPQPLTELYDPNHPLAQLRLEPDEVRVDGLREPPNYLVPTLRHVTNGEEHEAVESLLDLPEGTGRRFLGAGYYATSQPLESDRYELIQRNGSAYLYRERGTLPRIYAAPAIQITKSDDEALEAVGAPAFNPTRRAVVTIPAEDGEREGNGHEHGSLSMHLQSAPAGDARFEAEFMQYEADRVSASVKTGSRLMVVFNELYYAGWKAAIDGRRVPIWKVNYAFRGVMVPPGDHEIEMWYTSPAFDHGRRVTVATISMLSAVSLIIVFRELLRRAPGLRVVGRSLLQPADQSLTQRTRKIGASQRPSHRAGRNTRRSHAH